MLYAILCYHDEDVVCSWTQEEDDAVMAKLARGAGQDDEAGQAWAVARLMPTTSATTLRKKSEPPLVHRRPLRRDQGATARLLHRRLRGSGRGAGRRPRARQGQSWRRLRNPPHRSLSSSPERARRDATAPGSSCADIAAPAPGGRRAAALFPRPRHAPRRPFRTPACAR